MGKMCPNCGNILSDQAKFCPKCGTKQETQTRQEGKFCLFCGATLEPGARFCSSCGRDLMAAKKGNGGAVHSNVSAADYVKSGFDKVAGTLNEKIGESGPVKVHLSDLVSEVFKKHTMEETEELFIAGTKKTERIRNHSDMAKTMAVFQSTSVFGRYQSYFVFYFD